MAETPERKQKVAVFLGFLAAFLNIWACSFMEGIESKLTMAGRIPAKGILRMKDYNFFMLGDRIFVTIMDACIFYVLVQGWPLSAMAIAVCVLATFVWTAIWHKMVWMGQRHRPDSCYPRAGIVSSLGKIHLVYFGIQYALGFMGLWMVGYMAAGFRPWSLWVVALGLISAGAYFVTLGSDLVRGKFRRLSVPRG